MGSILVEEVHQVVQGILTGVGVVEGMLQAGIHRVEDFLPVAVELTKDKQKRVHVQ